MSKLARVAGFAWAAPLTLLGLIYVTLFTLLGWYRRTGVRGDALIWHVDVRRCPAWVYSRWHICGHNFGNVVVMTTDLETDRGRILLKHCQAHVRQNMVLGPLQPVLYTLAWAGLCACQHAHPYYDNPFEIDARRAAGQVVDIIGALKRAVAEGRIKVPAKKANR